MERLARWSARSKRVLREFFFLDAALTQARSRSSTAEHLLGELVRAADRRRAAARAHSVDPAQTAAGLELMREAIVLGARAAVVAKPGSPLAIAEEGQVQRALDPDGPIDARTVSPAVDAVAVQRQDAPQGLSRVVELLSDGDRLALDRLGRESAQQLLEDGDEVFDWLRRSGEQRSVRQLRVARAVRVAMTVLAAAAIVAVGAARVMRPTNVALHRPVQMSSRRANTPPDSGPAGLEPSGLVDGHKGGAYDVCTNYEVNPWVLIDLEKAEPIGEVKLFNRGDCCWGLHELPQVLELSTDGNNFEPVARQTTAYTEAAPWVVRLKGRSARFVRVRVDAADPHELVFSEIEVFRGR